MFLLKGLSHMDSLSQFIHLLSVQGSIDIHCRFSGGWQTQRPQKPKGVLPFHLILAGSAHLQIGRKRQLLQAGDVLVLPLGTAHSLKGLDGSVPSASLQRYFNGTVAEEVLDGEGDLLEMLCGEFQLSKPAQQLLASVPPVWLVQTAEREDCQELRELVAMLKRETIVAAPGAVAIIQQLSRTLFTLIFRAVLAQRTNTLGIISLLADKRLTSAVNAVLAAPANNWTIEDMAKCCHLSRATFARYFSASYHLTPLEWLTQIRMANAAELLLNRHDSIQRVAEACGYISFAAFSRAFKLHHGQTPGEFRKNSVS